MLFLYYFYNVACDIHSLKLIVSSLLRKVLNNSFCTFKSSLFLPLAALTFSAVNSRLLTFIVHFLSLFLNKIKENEINSILFYLAPQARLELATSRLTAVRSTNWAIEECSIVLLMFRLYIIFYSFSRVLLKILKKI